MNNTITIDKQCNENNIERTYEQSIIDIISKTPILSDEEKQQILSISESMNKAYNNSQIFRTLTEATISVLNDVKHPTDASKYFQCLRELNVHQCELVGLLFEYQKKQQLMVICLSEIQELEEELKVHKSSEEKKTYIINRINAQINIKKIELREYSFQLKNMRKIALGRKQELLIWDNIIKKLEPSLIKDGISTIDPDDHQLISYAIKFIKQTINTLGNNPNYSISEINNLFGQLETSLREITLKNKQNILIKNLTNREHIFLEKHNLLSNNLLKFDNYPL